MSELTPMMRQYQDIKNRHQDKILFFRLGDFYEMFQSDALQASQILGIALTQRHGEPMCGIPYHSAPGYIKKLLDAGQKIAICEQVTQPGSEKGIVKREVTEILTPGTLVDDNFLQSPFSNYTCALHLTGDRGALAMADLSTGELVAAVFRLDPGWEVLRSELSRFHPREVLVMKGIHEKYPLLAPFLESLGRPMITEISPWNWDQDLNLRRVLEYFSLAHPRALGLQEVSLELVPAGVLLDYWKVNTAHDQASHIRPLTVYHPGNFLSLDESSARNLELTANLRDQTTHSTLFEVLNHTRTALGARLLKTWIHFPLKELKVLNQRLDNLENLLHRSDLLEVCRNLLTKVYDFERLRARLALDKASPADLLALETSLRQVGDLHRQVMKHLPQFLSETLLTDRELDTIGALVDRIERTLLREPSLTIQEGGLIEAGFSSELDELRHLRDHSKEVLEAYRDEEQSQHALPQLKLKYNKIIGYFFEVSKAKHDTLPAYFERKQSLLGAERYTTPRLRELEETLLHAQDRIIVLEKQIFLDLRAELKIQMDLLGKTAAFVAQLDVTQSLAWTALRNHYVRPQLHEGKELSIVEGRHPVVENFLKDQSFVPNSLAFGQEDVLFLLTGPNMAGKSTFLRQNALIVLMAQLGSYVPAREARIGMVDKIFCRVGASDNLAGGESTFLVEMNETALILRNATEKSLVIMDEVGRGTSTKDGYSLAWAICEYLLENIRAKTLFATHFHELTSLTSPGLRNFSLAVYEDGSNVVFLRKVVEGAADHSYGIYVAQLAGIPASVLDRAQKILQSLDSPQMGYSLSSPGQAAEDRSFETASRAVAEIDPQTSLFDERDLFIGEIRSLNPEVMTPLEALVRLDQLKKKADQF